MTKTEKSVDISYLRDLPAATPEDIAISWYELAVRSKAVSLFYLPAAISLVCFTPELLSHLWALPLVALIFGLVSWWRFTSAVNLEMKADNLCPQARRRFDYSARASSFALSAIVALTIYATDGWQQWFALALVGVFLAGGAASLCSDFRLFCQFGGLLIALPSLAIVLRGDEQILFAGCVQAALVCLFAVIAFVSHQNYWRGLLTTRRHLRDLDGARKNLELVLEGSNFGTFHWVPGRSEVHLSSHLPIAIGKDPEEFAPYVGALENFFFADDTGRAREFMVGILKSPHEAAGELVARVLAADGKPRWFSFRGRVVQRDDNGRATRVAGTYEHITAQVEAEAALSDMRERMEQSEKLKTLGVLAGGVAHDFNNLLMAIHGNLELAEEETIEEYRGECLEQARRASLEAAELCDQLLAYAGKGRFSVTVFDLNELVEKMSQLLRVSVGRASDLQLDLQENLPRMKGDVSQIRQVLMNLLTNASEAMEGSRGRISLRTYHVETEDCKKASPELDCEDCICLEVTDEGCGMDEQTLRKIFDPFYTTKFTGRGLGLATVLGIVRNHGGDILVESKVGEGTKFQLFLPACYEEPSEEGVTVVDQSDQAKTILVVDDEKPIREISSRILSKVGHQVLVAENGAEALIMLEKHKGEIALVVLDLTMPCKDGYQTLMEIRETWPRLPVVLSSGYSADEVMQRAQASVQGYLKKPFTKEQLLKAVGRA